MKLKLKYQIKVNEDFTIEYLDPSIIPKEVVLTDDEDGITENDENEEEEEKNDLFRFSDVIDIYEYNY